LKEYKAQVLAEGEMEEDLVVEAYEEINETTNLIAKTNIFH